MLTARIYNIIDTFVLILLLFFLLLMIDSKAHGKSDLATISTNKLLPEGVLITQSLIDSAMPRLKQSQLGKILTRYYENCLGGARYWEQINSYRISWGNFKYL